MKTKNHFAGFTLIELLVVIAIIGVLAAMLLPALSASKAKAQAVFCLNNYKQLQTAWTLYVSDHNDRLPPNEGQDTPRPPRSDVHYWWAQGNMDFDDSNPQNTDASLLVNPEFALLGTYSSTTAAGIDSPVPFPFAVPLPLTELQLHLRYLQGSVAERAEWLPVLCSPELPVSRGHVQSASIPRLLCSTFSAISVKSS